MGGPPAFSPWAHLSLAAALASVPGPRVDPATPHTNMMHLYTDAPAERVLDRRDEIAARDGVWLIGEAWPAEVPGWRRAEIVVGDTSVETPDAEVVAWLRAVVG
jgi:hypothetical protein